jgi:hypothetical protein
VNGLPISTDNPIFLWPGTWTPTAYLADTVVFKIDPQQGTVAFAVPDVYPYPPVYFGEKWEVSAGSAMLTVIPAPPVGSVGLLGLVVLGRRRRGAC